MDRDITIIKHVVEHAQDVIDAQNRFGNDLNLFKDDKAYFNAICMSLLQIGELANHLSDDFMQGHGDIQWKAIIGMRNIVVHGYGSLVKERIWATINEDIPMLIEKCKGIVGLYDE
jgi:uncharacterized protein with HEPN domain